MLTGDDKGSSYMEDNKDKKPVNKGNPVREWISDNLRYIILIVAIIAIVAAVIFGVRVISSHLNSNEDQQPRRRPQLRLRQRRRLARNQRS